MEANIAYETKKKKKKGSTPVPVFLFQEIKYTTTLFKFL